MNETIKSLATWTAREQPGTKKLTGQYTIIEPLNDAHIEGLFSAVAGESNQNIWQYMPLGPFLRIEEFSTFLKHVSTELGWQVLVIKSSETADILGMFSLMNIVRAHGSVEVGCVAFGPKLKRSTIATEALYLLGKNLFEEMGYRRFEWKCNSQNAASNRAAERFGFQYEGIFRNHMVSKGENRDTAWYAMIDSDWPQLKARYDKWLSANNFDGDGKQILKLEDCN